VAGGCLRKFEAQGRKGNSARRKCGCFGNGILGEKSVNRVGSEVKPQVQLRPELERYRCKSHYLSAAF
jgi:hypothetical protein